MATKKEKHSENGDIEFFSPFDRGERTGKILSEYPPWFHKRRLQIMSDAIDENLRRLNEMRSLGYADHETISRLAQDVERRIQRRDELAASMPTLTGSQKDRLASLRKSVGEQLREQMPARTDCMKGLADPHKERTRLDSFNIDVRGYEDVARAASVPLDEEGRTTGKGGEKLWRIVSGALGEETRSDLELQKDYRTGTTRLANKLAAMLDGSADYRD